MKMIVKPRIDEQNWCRCGACSHKLFRITDNSKQMPDIEIKCHSCKAINIIKENKQR